MWPGSLFSLSRVAVVSKSFEGQTDKTEEWYGTQYKQEAISEETIEVNHCDHSAPIKSHNIGSRVFCFLMSAWLLLKFYKTILADCMPVFQKWANADLNGKFKLPMKNEFIPTNFEIYPLEKDSPSVPTLIKASVFAAQLYHQSIVTPHFLTALAHPCFTAHC